MPVTDFECKIARGQIDRYLGGGLLSSTALGGLEEHLGECAACKALVTERRAELLGKLSGAVPTHAVVSMPKREENPLIAALRARAEEEQPQKAVEPVEAPKAKSSPRYAKGSPVTALKSAIAAPAASGNPVLTKPILLAGLLGIVLVGMNAMSRANGGKGVMGGKAAESFAAESLPTTPTKRTAASTLFAKPAQTPAPAPVVKAAAKPVPAEEPLDETTAVEKAPVEENVQPMAPKPATVLPVAVKARARRSVRRKATVRKPRVAARKKIAAAPHTGVRVYGLDGRPL